MALVPAHLQPSVGVEVNSDFVVSHEKAERLLEWLKERDTDGRIRRLKDQVRGFEDARRGSLEVCGTGRSFK